MSGRPPDWPEPPPWIGYALGLVGCAGLLVVGLVSGGQARVWLTVAAVLSLLAVASEAGWLAVDWRPPEEDP